MKRRDLLTACGVGLAAVPAMRAFGTPCPPSLDGGNISCGASPDAPSWVATLNINRWTQEGSNTFDDVKAPDQGQYGNTGPRAALHAWCGGAFASGFGTHGAVIHWGGGHADYHGNEVYAFDLQTRSWTRLNDPSPDCAPLSFVSQGILPDGTPHVPHNFYHALYRPAANEFIHTYRETTNAGGGGYYSMTQFNLSNLTWNCDTGSSGISQHYADGSVYDGNRDVVWAIAGRSGNRVAKFDFRTGSWTSYAQLPGVYELNSPAYCPIKDCILFWSNNSSTARILDPSSPNSGSVAMSATGSAPTSFSKDMVHWSNNLGAFVYAKSKNSQLYTLTPPAGSFTGTWTWNQLPMSGSVSVDSGDVGSYGKFQVCEWGSTTLVYMASHDTGPVNVARLT